MWGQLKNYYDQIKDQLPQQLNQLTDQISQHLSPLTSSFNTIEEIQINNRTYRIIKVLGEGGYSTVYLVETSSPNREQQQPSLSHTQTPPQQYALKKILIGSRDQLLEAQREIDIMQQPQLKRHPNVLPLIDAAILPQSASMQHGSVNQQHGSISHIGYMLFPVFEINAWDYVQKRIQSSQPLHTSEILSIFIQISNALYAMHFSTPSLAHRDIKPHNILLNNRRRVNAAPMMMSNSSNNHSMIGGGGGGGGGDKDGAHILAASNTHVSQRSTDGLHAVLMDFGSTAHAVVQIESRSDALLLQESAERYCTAPYRAPELWDVPSECSIDAGVDIWSLGCVLYYLIVGETPFERTANVAGGSLMLAIVNCQYSWPDELSMQSIEDLKHLVSMCLEVDTSKRATIEQVLEKARSLIDG